MRSETVRLYQTLPHPCGYYGDRVARNLVIDPEAPNLRDIYGSALAHGFRRAGGQLYLPNCAACRACTPCRVPVERFEPDRSQRRCWRHNADLDVRECAASYTPERHALYRRYLHARHAGGGMDEAAASDFQRFLTASWSPTVFLEFRERGRLVAVAVTDVCAEGVSAVYTFFDPDERARGLGTFAILSQVEYARARALPHVYLGFWIDGHPKMDYKRRFRPLEVRTGTGWGTLA